MTDQQKQSSPLVLGLVAALGLIAGFMICRSVARFPMALKGG